MPQRPQPGWQLVQKMGVVEAYKGNKEGVEAARQCLAKPSTASTSKCRPRNVELTCPTSTMVHLTPGTSRGRDGPPATGQNFQQTGKCPSGGVPENTDRRAAHLPPAHPALIVGQHPTSHAFQIRLPDADRTAAQSRAVSSPGSCLCPSRVFLCLRAEGAVPTLRSAGAVLASVSAPPPAFVPARRSLQGCLPPLPAKGCFVARR